MKEKDYCLSLGKQEVSFSSKGRRMQMNVLRTKQVSHVGNRDDHGQPIAGLVSTARDAGDGLAVSRQVFRSYLVQTSEHLDANSEPNPVDNVQPV